ncbi:uncharacterized protein LOC129728753 [Wyeomyia smithii]|uniref:uncharacterized protein LOC129728753 n=1 Tax=Wyeomyia smithii TaxID=174621 RepID=UPI002468073F|nr:uncharacterized protein LOC129728753 [Wyeomyia smithii]
MPLQRTPPREVGSGSTPTTENNQSSGTQNTDTSTPVSTRKKKKAKRLIMEQRSDSAKSDPLKVPIPTFDGEYENWTKFKVMFKDLVDKTADPPAVKLYHLDKALVGSAAGIIDAKTINDGNYKHAWEILEEWYENLRHMVGTHIHGLFGMKKVVGESSKDLRSLVDECTRHVENLKFLQQEFTGVSEQFVIHLLSECLDRETRKRWESTIKHEKQQDKETETQQTNSNRTRTSGIQLSKKDEPQPTSSTQVTTATYSTNRAISSVLLLTAVVNVLDKNKNPHPCRVLLDSASQVNLISKKMATILDLGSYQVNISIAGVDGMQSRVNQGVEVEIRSRYLTFHLKAHCLVTQRVTSVLPTTAIDTSSWEIPAGVQLADPRFNSSDEIDMLIGNEWFLKLLLPGRIILAPDLPIINETKFGWVLGGSYNKEAIIEETVFTHSVTVDKLSDSIQRFRDVENVAQDFQLTTEEEDCENHFMATHTRDASGRYIVELPLKETVDKLSDSRSLALRRFYCLEKRLAERPELKQQYIDFMQEYESLGHCKEVFERNDPPGLRKWYLPHHAVLRPSNTTTKCRVVFDASAKTSGLSLNEVMEIGSISQSDLLTIVLRFRRPAFVLTADIAKMYRQIVVAPCHTPLQRVFWRECPTDPLRILELTTVTYGTASAPFLATRALLQLAVDEKQNFPLAAGIVEKSVYVDNALFDFDSLQKAFEAQKQLIDMMKAGGLHLHKWSSNMPELLDAIPEADREQLVSLNQSGTNEIIKTLGLMWNPNSDELIFLSLPTSDKRLPTKRQILSLVAQMFDSRGLVAPVVAIGKILMQMVWKERVNWDDNISNELHQYWTLFFNALDGVDQLRIPRRVVAPTSIAFELHGFADASDVAYGACVYIRSILEDGTANMKLISGESKVAPIEPLSIPRKELLAARLLHRLTIKITTALEMSFKKMDLWSDSQVVLAWLAKPPA